MMPAVSDATDDEIRYVDSPDPKRPDDIVVEDETLLHGLVLPAGLHPGGLNEGFPVKGIGTAVLAALWAYVSWRIAERRDRRFRVAICRRARTQSHWSTVHVEYFATEGGRASAVERDPDELEQLRVSRGSRDLVA